VPEPEAEGRPDPYALRPGDPHPGRAPDSAGARRPTRLPDQPDEPDLAALRRTRYLAMLSGIAAVLSVAFAPVGLALGVATLVVAYLRRGDARRARLGSLSAAIPVAGGVFAVVVGGILTVALVLIGDELRDYQQCVQGANTRVAEERCQNELIDALDGRFNLR
jgi:hypothetical protein